MTPLMTLKEKNFVVWRPGNPQTPRLVIGTLQLGNPSTLVSVTHRDFAPHQDHADLWVLPVSSLDGILVEGGVYHYFIEVLDTNPYKANPSTIQCTDPFAYAVDWRLRAALPNGAGYDDEDRDPAAVIMFSGGKLLPCDAGGELPKWNDAAVDPPRLGNNSLVIYELPTSWTRGTERNGVQLDAGSFRDTRALIEVNAQPATFAGVAALENRSHLQELGVNALELLPPADSFVDRQWGYATSNYLAADWDLGKPSGQASSTATSDLIDLIGSCHRSGIRFIADMAMGFANHCPLENVNSADFLIQEGAKPPDPELGDRRSWGGRLFKYGFRLDAYDPVSGQRNSIYPARQFMIAQALYWIEFYRIDGIRMDSIKTIHNWDFVRDFRQAARDAWKRLGRNQGIAGAKLDAQFLVVGEILDENEDLEIVRQNRLDGIWNESFKRRIRKAVLGQGGANFEESVRKMIDCRALGFSDLSQVVNYLGSHDVEGFENERFYNYLDANGVADADKGKRFKLGFSCLLTAVGVPMILAGDEFADRHDLSVNHPFKQMDTVNFERFEEPWRKDIFEYVARLIKLRASHPALSANDTAFLHVDFDGGRRVLVWRRGRPGSIDQVIVVANFSEWKSSDAPGGGFEYVIPNWPAAVPGLSWRDIGQNRDIPAEWAGREPLFSWEAKVYARWKPNGAAGP